MCLPACKIQVVEQGESKSEFLQSLSSCKQKRKLQFSKVLQQDRNMDWDAYVLHWIWAETWGKDLTCTLLPSCYDYR